MERQRLPAELLTCADLLPTLPSGPITKGQEASLLLDYDAAFAVCEDRVSRVRSLVETY